MSQLQCCMYDNIKLISQAGLMAAGAVRLL